MILFAGYIICQKKNFKDVHRKKIKNHLFLQVLIKFTFFFDTSPLLPAMIRS